MTLRYQKYIDCLKLDEAIAHLVDLILWEVEVECFQKGKIPLLTFVSTIAHNSDYYLSRIPLEQALQIITYVEQVIVMCSDKYQEHVKMYLDSCQKNKFLFGFNIECFNDAPFFRDYDGKLLQEYLM